MASIHNVDHFTYSTNSDVQILFTTRFHQEWTPWCNTTGSLWTTLSMACSTCCPCRVLDVLREQRAVAMYCRILVGSPIMVSTSADNVYHQATSATPQPTHSMWHSDKGQTTEESLLGDLITFGDCLAEQRMCFKMACHMLLPIRFDSCGLLQLYNSLYNSLNVYFPRYCELGSMIHATSREVAAFLCHVHLNANSDCPTSQVKCATAAIAYSCMVLILRTALRSRHLCMHRPRSLNSLHWPKLVQ